MKKRNEKHRRMARDTLVMPKDWIELNRSKASSCEYVVVCSDRQNHTAVYYSDIPASELSDAEADDIRRLAQAKGIGEETFILGLVLNNSAGARLIKRGGNNND